MGPTLGEDAVMARVTVVGGGVLGLTVGARAGAGRAPRAVRARRAGVATPPRRSPAGCGSRTTSSRGPGCSAWGRVALDRFTALARDPDAGVAVREGVVVERGDADRWWTDALPGWREAQADELPAGASGGVVATVPLVTMPVFLPWLETRCLEAGVELVSGFVRDLAEVPGDVVVVAAGLRSGTLLDDHAGVPSRGQVALLANPGLTRWVVDDDHPDGMVYALPHPGWVVCGGTDVAGSWDTEPDRAVHEAILRRVREVVPALAGAEVLGARVGLRPVAPEVRLAASESADGRS